ncbi:unnamed protein product [Didymodactylos carnosus]|uniref:C2H2-type domain-containing protein n=1 Tax=Didymodactylos carnosus TaxID=1234261 RepID=A0A8S2D176_9BILA|nr:unnamed protein product [Didymodactylos carnosus]CAF3560308.1 unnamed protein product [Didymodactylos carnosus]
MANLHTESDVFITSNTRKINKKVHKCSICDKAFARPNKLHQHIEFSHKKQYPYECIVCGKPYSSKDHANRHYRKVHQPVQPTNTNNSLTFRCPVDDCTKVFVSKKNLDRHVRNSHTFNGKKMKCPYCDVIVVGVKAFHSHLTDSHGGTPGEYKCIDCPKVFPTLKQLSHHRKVHGAYKCDLCDQTFQCLTYLNQHRNSKIHNNSYVCENENCGKKFSHLRNLRQHYKIQHKDICFICPIVSCSTTFTCQALVGHHLLSIHTFEDIYKQLKCYPAKGHCRHDVKGLLSGFDDCQLKSKTTIINENGIIHDKIKQLLEILINIPSTELMETTNQIEHEENSNSLGTDASNLTPSFDSLSLDGFSDADFFLLN